MGSTSDRNKSALVVVVPEAETVVGPWRNRLDPAAALGMPAHITLLYPFAPTSMIREDLMAKVSDIVQRFPTFDFSLASVRWFGENVVYLAPDPAERFVNLTRAFVVAFPDWRPYDGAYDETVPHLTLGDRQSTERLREASLAVQPALPVRSTAHEVCLMIRSKSPPSWTVRDRFPLSET
jgi:2'-5' RNA ligase